MLFNTIQFVIFFVAVVSIIVVVKNRKFQHIFLLSSSYFFFYYSSNYLITLLVYTTFWDFYLANLISKSTNPRRKKIFLLMSLGGNLGLLGFFKYADFAVTQFNIMGKIFDLSNIPILNLALPIGISFYTFHSIGYILDVYRGHISPSKSLLEYAIFIAFFPQLVAGPILRAKQFLPQLREKIGQFETGTKLRQILIENSNLKLGVTLMAMGFFKKMFIADNISPLVNEIFSAPIGLDSFRIILGTLGFGIQIYCDFSGYSDIAIGAALIMGFKIPPNFNRPYFATSPTEFWRRWNISLSSWLRDYLYIPLGGNQKSTLRTFFNLFIVMFLGGLWHGASWNFILWGILHGTYLVIHKTLTKSFPTIASHKIFTSKICIILSIFITQYFIFLAWIPFRVKDVDQMIYAMHKYLVPDLNMQNILPFILTHKFSIFVIGIFIVFQLIFHKQKNIFERISHYRLRYWTIFLIIIMLSVLLFFNGNPEDFIYFKF